MAVDLLAFVAIDPRFHPVGVAVCLFILFDDEGDLSTMAVSCVGGCWVFHAQVFDVAFTAVG